jgi:nucleoside recognition membrane protein YjiH
MFLLAFEVIRTNYNGFFKKLGARFGPLIEAMTKTATPRQESTASLT